MTRDLIAIRCDRGADIVRQIGFPEATADAVRSLDEHWNGKGYPDGLRGDAIPQGMPMKQALGILQEQAGTRLCAETVAALEAHLANQH